MWLAGKYKNIERSLSALSLLQMAASASCATPYSKSPSSLSRSLSLQYRELCNLPYKCKQHQNVRIGLSVENDKGFGTWKTSSPSSLRVFCIRDTQGNISYFMYIFLVIRTFIAYFVVTLVKIWRNWALICPIWSWLLWLMCSSIWNVW